MLNGSLLKRVVRSYVFPDGSVHRIGMGPLRGQLYKVSNSTGMSTWYSGPEREHQKTFRRVVPKGGVVIDVGANWGSHTLLFASLVGPNGRVFSLEPLPSNFDELKWHVNANNHKNVTIKQLAASNKNGKASFTVSNLSAMCGLTESYAHQCSESQIVVETRKLDSLANEWGLEKVNLIKIDVEGAESQVLEGAIHLMERYRPTMIVDLHNPTQDVLVAKMLASIGYNLERIAGPPILRQDVGWPETEGVWGTIIASPK